MALLEEMIQIQEDENDEVIFEKVYARYEEELKNRENRPELMGKFIFINEKPEEDGKDNAFWHISSIGADDSKFDSYPCNNHICYQRCKFLCDVEHEENHLSSRNSVPCIYRSIHLPLIKILIEMVNQKSQSPNLKVWESINNNTKEKSFCIRYESQQEGIDYIAIFAKKGGKNGKEVFYTLKTAFPVSLKSYKRRFKREYENYIEKRAK